MLLFSPHSSLDLVGVGGHLVLFTLHVLYFTLMWGWVNCFSFHFTLHCPGLVGVGFRRHLLPTLHLASRSSALRGYWAAGLLVGGRPCVVSLLSRDTLSRFPARLAVRIAQLEVFYSLRPRACHLFRVFRVSGGCCWFPAISSLTWGDVAGIVWAVTFKIDSENLLLFFLRLPVAAAGAGRRALGCSRTVVSRVERKKRIDARLKTS